MGDINAKVGDREVGDVMARFGMERWNENGDCLIDRERERTENHEYVVYENKYK